MTNRKLDWRGSYDEKSRAFRSVAGIEDEPLKSKRWACDVVLDQGQEGACVGFGWSHELCAAPQVILVNDAFAFALYNSAKRIDEWPGEDYDGTSVLAGAKVVKSLTYDGKPVLTGYSWAFGVEDIVRTIAYKGPVVLGITWYDNMYEPDDKNYVHVSGAVAGGHCILANGVKVVLIDKTKPATYDNLNMDKSRVRLHNSWGESWGRNGEAFLTLSDLTKLIEDQQGEACLPVRNI